MSAVTEQRSNECRNSSNCGNNNNGILHDFDIAGSGEPAFLKWCFHTPWCELASPLRDGKNSISLTSLRLENDVAVREEYKKWSNVVLERDWFDRRVHTLDPRPFSLRRNLHWAQYQRDALDTPLRHYGWHREINTLSQTYRDNDGFLPAESVFRFIEQWGRVVPCNYMLDLLRAVPRSSLMRYKDHFTFLDSLEIVFKRYVYEIVHRPSSTPFRFDGTCYFFDEGSGRVWLQISTKIYHSLLVSQLIDFSQLNVLRSTNEPKRRKRNYVPQLSVLRSTNDSKLRERIDYPQLSVRSTNERNDDDVMLSFATVSKTLLILMIARLSNDFFTDSFLDMLRDDEITELYRRGMRKGAILAMLPYSLFAPRAVVEEECFLYNSHRLSHPILQTCLEYMLLIRRGSTPFNYDISLPWIVANALKKLNYDYERTKKRVFFPVRTQWLDPYCSGSKNSTCFQHGIHNDKSNLILRSLECMLRKYGLEQILPTLMTYDLPKSLLAITHRYFAGLTWNYLTIDYDNAS